VFVEKGVKKLRLTGGEPLVRKNIMSCSRTCRAHLKSGALEELTLTTNGSQLTKLRQPSLPAAASRINVSIDTLDPGQVQGHHPLGRSRQGLDGSRRRRRPACRQDQHGGAEEFQRARDRADDRMVPWPGHGPDPDRDHAAGRDRGGPHRPVSAAVAGARRTSGRFTLEDIPYKTGGPARYVEVKETGGGSASSRR
jgi:cyclic pyranopterin phosphate synthase